jgi:hypothetical protein
MHCAFYYKKVINENSLQIKEQCDKSNVSNNKRLFVYSQLTRKNLRPGY